MKRYLVFAYPAYYPGGGWSDFQRSFDLARDAIDYADSILHDNDGGVEVIDLETGEDVYTYPHRRQGP
jgi:hypothetical protein